MVAGKQAAVAPRRKTKVSGFNFFIFLNILSYVENESVPQIFETVHICSRFEFELPAQKEQKREERVRLITFYWIRFCRDLGPLGT